MVSIYALATTTISILRGVNIDAYGDPVDARTIIAQGIPAAVIERNVLTTTPDNPTPRRIRAAVGVVGSAVDVRDDDQIRDERTDFLYAVLDVSQEAVPGLTSDKEMTLRRAS